MPLNGHPEIKVNESSVASTRDSRPLTLDARRIYKGVTHASIEAPRDN